MYFIINKLAWIKLYFESCKVFFNKFSNCLKHKMLSYNKRLLAQWIVRVLEVITLLALPQDFSSNLTCSIPEKRSLECYELNCEKCRDKRYKKVETIYWPNSYKHPSLCTIETKCGSTCSSAEGVYKHKHQRKILLTAVFHFLKFFLGEFAFWKKHDKNY